MKRTMIVAIVSAMTMLTISELGAEPITGADALNDPWRTNSKGPDMAEVEARFQAKDYDWALKLLQRMTRGDADLPPAQVIMARLFMRAGMVTRVEAALQQAVVDAPDDPEAYMLLAALAMSDRDMANAEKFCQKARGLLTTFDRSANRKVQLQSWIYAGLASLAEVRRDWAGGQKIIEEWLRLDSENPKARQWLAFCMFQQKNKEGALAQLRLAVKADGTLAPPEVILARYYHQAGDRANAEKWIEVALASAPKNVNTRIAAGRLDWEMGQLEKARQQAMAAVRINSKSADALSFRGTMALCEKDYISACMYFELALKQTPDNYAIRNNLALALIEQDDKAKKDRAAGDCRGQLANVSEVDQPPFRPMA